MQFYILVIKFIYIYIYMCDNIIALVSGDCPVLCFQIISKFLCHFLRGTRVAEHSVPAHMVLKFSNMMTELHDLLGKLGQALLHREHVRK